MKTTLLIDADPIVYRASASSEDELAFTPDVTVVTGDFKKGKNIVKRNIKELSERFDTDEMVFFFTSEINFRKTVDPQYKGNRQKRKPAGFKKLKNWTKTQYESIEIEGLEADDALGIAATCGDYNNFIVCSPDKDLEQFPCRIWNGKLEFTQTASEAILKRWMQSLHGDACDGYAGIRGYGPKKAAALLNKVKDGNYYPAVLKAYLDEGLTEEDALRNIRLATILSVDDWDAEAFEPILFTP